MILPEPSETTPDCERCCGLCCVAPPFFAGEDFAIDKGPGVPCPYLDTEFRCTIHDRLAEEGFRGCEAYDCHGAGQKVTQVTFGGRDRRREPEIAESMFATFKVMERIHEQLGLLSSALGLEAAAELHPELQHKRDELVVLSQGTAAELTGLDFGPHRAEVQTLLRQVGELMRAAGLEPAGQ